MKDKVNIVSSCKMGPGTFEAKFIPLSKLEKIGKIVVLRKSKGSAIAKLEYRILPRLCKNPLLNTIVAPLMLAKLAMQYKPKFLLAYHYVPHFYYAYFASLLTGVPYVLGQTGNDDQLLAVKPLKGWFLRHVISKAIRLNVPGEKSLRFWQEMGFKHVKVLHSTIDTDYYTPVGGEKQYDFVYVGRLEEYKGAHKIITSIAKLAKSHPSVKLVVIGYGSAEESLKQMVQKLGLKDNVEFKGFQQDTRYWLRQGRIFVMASDTEGLPCSLMEAMSCEMLCISSEVGNIADIIKPGVTGFSYTAGDQNKLEELMLMAYEQEPEMNTIKTAAREIIVREHSHYSAAGKWQELIDIIKREK